MAYTLEEYLFDIKEIFSETTTNKFVNFQFVQMIVDPLRMASGVDLLQFCIYGSKFCFRGWYNLNAKFGIEDDLFPIDHSLSKNRLWLDAKEKIFVQQKKKNLLKERCMSDIVYSWHWLSERELGSLFERPSRYQKYDILLFSRPIFRIKRSALELHILKYIFLNAFEQSTLCSIGIDISYRFAH